MSKPHDRKALGKGLSALLPTKGQAKPAAQPPPTPEPSGESASGARKIPIDQIDPNPVQPRTVFDSHALAELSQSIVANGIIQPLVLQRAGDRYQLVAGSVAGALPEWPG